MCRPYQITCCSKLSTVPTSLNDAVTDSIINLIYGVSIITGWKTITYINDFLTWDYHEV